MVAEDEASKDFLELAPILIDTKKRPNAEFSQTTQKRESQKVMLTAPKSLPQDLVAAVGSNIRTPRRGRRKDILGALGESFHLTPLASPSSSLTNSCGTSRRRLSSRLLSRVSMFEAGMDSFRDQESTRDSFVPGKLEESALTFLSKSNPNNSLGSGNDERNSDGFPDDVVLLNSDDIRALVKNSSVSQCMESVSKDSGDSSSPISKKKKQKSRQRKKAKKSRKVDKKTMMKKKKKKKAKIPDAPDRVETCVFEEKQTETDNGEDDDPNAFDVFRSVRNPKYDFADFMPPVFNNPDDQPKTEEQSDLILRSIEESLIFKEFRSGGNARNKNTMEMLVNAFEPITLNDLVLEQRRKDLKRVKLESMRHLSSGEQDNENAEWKDEQPYIYIVENGQVDFQVNGVTIGTAKAGETFGEEAILNHQTMTIVPSVSIDSVAQGNDDDPVDLDLDLEPSLLRLDSHTYQGILQTQVKESDELKRQIIEGVDFLKPLLNSGNEEESEKLISTLASLLVREELLGGDLLENILHREVFSIVHKGTVDVAKQNDQMHILTSLKRKGDYYGERAILGNIPKRVNENQNESQICLKVTSEEAVVYSMTRTSLECALGRAHLEKLHDLLIFQNTDIFQKVTEASNFSNISMDHLARKIEQKTFLPGEGQDLLKDENPDQPAIYVIQKGAASVTYTTEGGRRIEKIVQAGEVFGDIQIKQDEALESDKLKFGRGDGFQATTLGEEPVSIGALPLQEIQNAQEEFLPPRKNAYADFEYFQLRNKIRTKIQADFCLDDIEKISLLGKGQFGEVWMVAVDVFKTGVDSLKQRFALKIQEKNDEIRGNEALDAIRLEIEAMKALNHPNIVDLVHIYESETSISLLMGLIPGGELWNLIHKEDGEGNFNSGIAESDAKFYIMVVADTLAFIHDHNYVFRDLKPENIMLDADGYPVIVDFGFAKHIPDEGNGKTYTFCGTPNYAAPEIITNSGHGKPVDYWALGITIYEMVTGENPFFYNGMEQLALYTAICEEEYYKYSDDKSTALVDLTNGLLEKEPVLRLGTSAEGVAAILEHEWFEELELSNLRSRSHKAPWKPQGDVGEDMDDEAVEKILARLNKSHVDVGNGTEQKSAGALSMISLPFDDSAVLKKIEDGEKNESHLLGNDFDCSEETIPLSEESDKSNMNHDSIFEILEGENEDAISTEDETLYIEDDEDHDSFGQTVPPEYEDMVPLQGYYVPAALREEPGTSSDIKDHQCKNAMSIEDESHHIEKDEDDDSLEEEISLAKEQDTSTNVKGHQFENTIMIEKIEGGENEDAISIDDKSIGVEHMEESMARSKEGGTAEIAQHQIESDSAIEDQSSILEKNREPGFHCGVQCIGNVKEDRSSILGEDRRGSFNGSFQSAASGNTTEKTAPFFSEKFSSKFGSSSATNTPNRRRSYLNGERLRYSHSAGSGRRKRFVGEEDQKKAMDRRSTILGALQGLGLEVDDNF